MPVTQSTPPSEAEEAVRAALDHFAGVPETRLHALAGTRPAELAPTVPHPVYTLGLSDLTAAGAGLGTTQATGWRYLLRQDDQVVASAETVADQAGRALFSHFNSGPFVASTAAALSTAEGLAETQEGSYELRLLHVPALYAMALWLHGDAGDLLIPLAPAPEGIEANRAYPADELLGELAERGRQIPALAPDDTRGA
ncbi:MAG TPA: hypothetical protein VFJ85_17265 [Acidimicrobiales bacterium]|nr:hypothetical protein [Acidimicrobiales bacterium]